MHMTEAFKVMLAEDGKKNSLGRVNDVVESVLNDHSRLEELYETMFSPDVWVRMRAVDAFEKICRVHPDWIEAYIDKIQSELDASTQASIQWHIAQIYEQVNLNGTQKRHALDWLTELLRTTDVDWIVSANAMKTLGIFVQSNDYSKTDFERLLRVQKGHKSNAVVKRANKLLAALKSKAG